MSDSVLGGLRVVETAGLVAELAGRLLADLGADVCKIEPPGGAPTRRHGSSFFTFYDAGKRSFVADSRSAADGERVARLIESADVWLDSTSPAEPLPWNLDPDRLAAENPRLVVARVTPFGLDGPHAAFRASDLVAQAAGGMVFTNGYPGETPLQGPGLQAYHAASLHVVIGVLLALVERERSGVGQTVDCGLQEAVVAALEQTTAAWNAERRVEARRGPLHWTRMFRTCRCRDGYVMLCLVSDWTTLVGWLMERGYGAELAGAEWQDFYFRRDHAEEVFAVLERWAVELDCEEILAGAQLRRIPFAAVRRPELLLDDPQLAAREFFTPIPGTTLVFPGPPFRMSKTPLRTRAPAPNLGASTPPLPIPPLPVGERSHAKRAGEGETPRRRALDGIRVLDFTHVVAGPIATRILADHGADVIKVERMTTLDRGERRGGFFGNLNRGKRAIALNLSDPRGVALAKRLAAQSDVVIDNFSARVMASFGLHYDRLKALRPDVIAIGMSGFGKTGPYKDYVSFGPTLHALCGHTSLLRPEGKDPAGWGFSHSDVCAGLNGAMAVVAALLHRAFTGEGQAIDLSQLESVTSLMGPMLLALANDGTILSPPLDRSQEGPGAPHGVYRCAGVDRWVALAILDDDEWLRFREVVGEPWTTEARFSLLESRIAHAAVLDRLVEAWTARRSPDEITTLCQRRGVAAFTVANGEDLCARDPHLQARGYWATVPTREGGVVTLDGVPIKLSLTPGRVDRPGPLHGEHADEILGDVLGLSADAVTELREAGIVA